MSHEWHERHTEGFELIVDGEVNKLITGIVSGSLDVNYADYDGQMFIHSASARSCLNLVKFLHENGSRINNIDRWNQTPLDYASSADVHEYLLKAGAKNGPGIAGIMDGVVKGDLEVVKGCLLKYGISAAQYRNHDKRTPLHLACSTRTINQLVIVELLLLNGADSDAEDRMGEKAINNAKAYGFKDICEAIENRNRF